MTRTTFPGRSKGPPPGAAQTGASSGETDAAARGSGLDPDDLRGLSEEINREFPLVIDRTGLVLYATDPGHLQGQWQVAPNDLSRALSAFSAQDRDVEIRLRLLRLVPGGGSREVEAIRRKANVSGLQGQVSFGVEPGEDAYQAELGLATERGGWLLLVRSNRAEPPRPPRPAESGGLARAAGFAVTDHDVPPAPESGPVPAEVQGSAEVEPALAAYGPPLEPVFPLPTWFSRKQVPTSVLGPQDAEAAPDRSPIDAAAASGFPQSAAWVPLPPPLMPSTEDEGGGGNSVLASLYDPRGALSSREFSRATAGGSDLELHAELVVWGRAEPGRLIDLFGRQVRADADGRFFLRRPVARPILLSQALASSGDSSAETDTE